MSEDLSRRKALSLLAGGIAALWTGAVGALAAVFASTPLRALRGSSRVSLGTALSFDESFRLITLDVPFRDGWLERNRKFRVYARLQSDGSPQVLSARCTHLGCTVRWHQDAGEFQCPCHGGRFNEAGEVLGGPPPRPLQSVDAAVEDGELLAELRQL